MAAQDSFDSHPAAPYGTVGFDCFIRVDRTSRRKAAGAGQQGREKTLVCPDQPQHRPLQHLSDFRSASPASITLSVYVSIRGTVAPRSVVSRRQRHRIPDLETRAGKPIWSADGVCIGCGRPLSPALCPPRPRSGYGIGHSCGRQAAGQDAGRRRRFASRARNRRADEASMRISSISWRSNLSF